MSYRAFRTTKEAYDECQCEPSIQDGDVLIVEREQVIGLASTWPVAITEKHGELHTPELNADMVRLMASAGYTPTHVQMAVNYADRLGWPVNPQWREVLTVFRV